MRRSAVLLVGIAWWVLQPGAALAHNSCLYLPATREYVDAYSAPHGLADGPDHDARYNAFKARTGAVETGETECPTTPMPTPSPTSPPPPTATPGPSPSSSAVATASASPTTSPTPT